MVSQPGKAFFRFRKSFPNPGKHFLGSENGFPTRESISDVPKIVSQPGRAFPTFRKWFPKLGEHFRRSENRFPTWEGISDAPKIVSQTGRAFPTLRKRGFQMSKDFNCKNKKSNLPVIRTSDPGKYAPRRWPYPRAEWQRHTSVRSAPSNNR